MNEKMCPSSNRHFAWIIPFRTNMPVRGDTYWVIYTPVFPILIKYEIFSLLHCISFHFVRLFCKLSSSGSSDPYHFGGTRSVLSWETIVHYPRYKLRGQIRLKDTTLSLGSGQHSHLFVFVLLLQVCFFYFWFLNEHRNYNLKTNFCCVHL